jgi:hypothetical protein
MNERLDEAGRCIELLKESVESLERFFEDSLQSNVDKGLEIESAQEKVVSEVEKLKNAVGQVEEKIDAIVNQSRVDE